jgi:hypothetical protein
MLSAGLGDTTTMNNDKKLNEQRAATFYRGVLAEAEDAEPDDLLTQAARGVREREARRRDEAFDRALGEGRR